MQDLRLIFFFLLFFLLLFICKMFSSLLQLLKVNNPENLENNNFISLIYFIFYLFIFRLFARQWSCLYHFYYSFPLTFKNIFIFSEPCPRKSRIYPILRYLKRINTNIAVILFLKLSEIHCLCGSERFNELDLDLPMHWMSFLQNSFLQFPLILFLIISLRQ